MGAVTFGMPHSLHKLKSAPETILDAKVQSAIAQQKILKKPLTYQGITAPQQVVALRSQAEGQLQTLTVDVGDPVQQGQVLAQLNDTLFKTNLTEAEAEASRLAEVSRTQNQFKNAKIQIEQPQAEAEQAQADARRLEALAEKGVVPEKNADLAQTEAVGVPKNKSAPPGNKSKSNKML